MKRIKSDLALVEFFIRNDFTIAMNAFHSASKTNNDKAGCYSLLRMLFPLIDHVAQLVAGKKGNHSEALKQYIGCNMGKINQLYEHFAGMIVYMYRHGLLHQIQPNRIIYKGAIVEWEIYYRENGLSHLSVKKEGKKKRRLCFDIENFASDFLKTIKDIREQLKNDKELPKRFMNALKDMQQPLYAANPGKKWLVNKDFQILN